jgi:enediyne biosynthesis protein E4
MNKIFHYLLTVFSLVVTESCVLKQAKTQFELIAPQTSGISFANTIAESPSFNILSFEYIYNGAGVAAGDINNDGLQDIFFAGNQVSSRLYLNKGNFHFEDITNVAGIATTAWCTGVTMVDINADHLLDIYVCTVHPDTGKYAPNLCFINKGSDKNGVPHFEESAAVMHLADTGYSTQSAFFDYDKDGDLDMYLLTNGNVDYNRNELRVIVNDGSAKSTDRLYRNEGIDKKSGLPLFNNVSKQAGITMEGWGLGITVTDINKDGWPDLVVANDFISNDLVWINNKAGGFVNDIHQLFRHESQNSMGIDAADINNDALIDVATVDMKPFTNERDKSLFSRQQYDKFYLGLQHGYEPQFMRNMLQLNNGNNSFSEIGQLAGIHATDWSWSVLLADYDNDGYRDMYITNGYRKDVTDLDYLTYATDVTNQLFGTEATRASQNIEKVQQLKDNLLPNFMYRNQRNCSFSDVSASWGLNKPSLSNGAIYTDLDNDGDLDIVTNNLNEKAFVYRNNINAGKTNSRSASFLKVQFAGNAPNTLGIGAKVMLAYGKQIQYAEMFTTRGYKSCMPHQLHFGLDTLAVIDSLLVEWPMGQTQVLYNLKPNQTITLKQSDAGNRKISFQEHQQLSLFTEAVKTTGIEFNHNQNNFVDFKLQPLLPYELSKCGSGVAVGDLNGDGCDDVFFGASLGDTSCIFFQRAGGLFEKQILELNNAHDDTGALIFDADSDGDNDLLVVSGGNENMPGSSYYQNRLYKNNGSGKWIIDSAALPISATTSGGSIAAADYDKDGDLDICIAGKLSPKNYPLPGQTFLLQNNVGIFKDVTDEVAPGLRNLGMVNSVLWTDIDNDSNIDLVLAGEWMPICFFKNKQGKFTNITNTTGLAANTGCWNSVATGDFDKDGDIDFIVGNLGENNSYRATAAQPLRIFAKDFNGDKRIDPITTYYLSNREVTTAYRDELTDQIVAMRRRFQRYADFGKAPVNEIITPSERQGAYEAACTYLQTSYIENAGNGKFVMKALPICAQFAPVYGLQVGYFNDDNFLDVLMIGNNYSTNVIAGWYDAFTGLLLAGDGAGNFLPVNSFQSGFTNNLDGKALCTLYLEDGTGIIIAANNNGKAGVFRYGNTSNTKKIPVQPLDAVGIIALQNGKKVYADVAYGSGYCSQSSRRLVVPADAASVEIRTFSGQKRVIDFSTQNYYSKHN